MNIDKIAKICYDIFSFKSKIKRASILNFDQLFAQLGEPRKPNEEQRQKRVEDAEQLVHDIIGRNAEYFADPENRLEFIKNQSAKDFFYMSQYINAKLRGEKPHELRHFRPEERRGGDLPLTHTPSSKDKRQAFANGFAAVQEYLSSTDDSVEKQIQGAAMATEALIIWVHPFIDGNGRTSRFMSKLIEDGATDIDELVEHTAVSPIRRTYDKIKYVTKESLLIDANDNDLLLEDEEREEMRATAERLPSDVKGMYLSIKRLLENDDVRAQANSRRTLNLLGMGNPK